MPVEPWAGVASVSPVFPFVGELMEEIELLDFPAVRGRALYLSHQYTTLWRTA